MMTATPVTGRTLRVDQSVAVSRSMKVCKMSPADIHGLKKGKRIRVFIATNNGPKFLKGMTLRALCAFMPTVAKALYDHNAARGGTIENIILPAHAAATYKRVFGWMAFCIEQGKVTKFARCDRKNALQIYKGVKDLADSMGIGYVSKGMAIRIQAMTKI